MLNIFTYDDNFRSVMIPIVFFKNQLTQAEIKLEKCVTRLT